MELEEFITDTLLSIARGLGNANKELAKMHGKTVGVDAGSRFVMKPEEGNAISFDVAVTVTQENTKSGGGKIKIAVVSIGGSIENANSQQHVTRIKFDIIPSEYIG